MPGENPNWIPPMEFVMKKKTPRVELEAWASNVFGKSFTLISLLENGQLLIRVYSSDKSKRMQFRLRWSSWIERPYQSW